jgi:esterase/lipase superfamily enzyme
VCEVTIPVRVHRRGEVERPAWWRLEFSENPRKHVVVRAITPLGLEAFLTRFDDTLEDGQHNPGRDALVFIHGFNVTFATAARRTAQMVYDLDFPGAPVLFSWPSDGRMSAYFSDREDVEWAVAHVEQFLQDLRQRSEVGRIHLVAHSMGNQALIRTLYNLALRGASGGEPLFDNVVLAAPDFDANRFTEQIAPQVVSLARRWTLYASEKDFALDTSTALSARRLGLPLALAEGIDTVDASGVDVAPWSVPETHSYYASKERVMRDLRQVLGGVAPVARELLRRRQRGRIYWALEPLP